MSIIGSDYTAMKYYEYNEFGKEEEKGDTGFINEITYTGAISEGDNIYYMNARFYDANTGRFLSQDTYTGNAWEPMSQNLYTYCGNNPINYVDPTGHSGENILRWLMRTALDTAYSIAADKQAEFFLDTWINGDGSDLSLSGDEWDEYMSDKPHADSDALAFIANKGTGEYTDENYKDFYSSNQRGQNGYSSGYKLIHVPSTVTVTGIVTYDKEKDVYFANFTYTLTDRMDPNFDSEKAKYDGALWATYKIAYGFDKCNDYNISITWSDSFELSGDYVRTVQRGNSAYQIGNPRAR